MIEQFAASLERPISPTRLAAYRPANGTDLDMVVNYFFNIELAESLYPSLHAFEVALRNTIHTTLSNQFQTNFWFDRHGLLANWQLGKIKSARDDLPRRGKPHDADRIVAELTFGFWHSMFNRIYERALWRWNRNALLGMAFPAIPRGLRNRQDVWDRCDVIRDLRNRVFHYEPVWNDPDLPTRHVQTLDALGWISLDMLGPIALSDRFITVHWTGRSLVEQKVKAYVGIT